MTVRTLHHHTTVVATERTGSCLALRCECWAYAFTYRSAGWPTCICGHVQGTHRRIEVAA